MAVDFDVVPCLCHINTIEHVEETLSFDRHGESVIQQIEEYVGGMLVRSGDGEVINLSHEDDTVAVDEPGVEARFVCCGSEAEIAEDGIGVIQGDLALPTELELHDPVG